METGSSGERIAHPPPKLTVERHGNDADLAKGKEDSMDVSLCLFPYLFVFCAARIMNDLMGIVIEHMLRSFSKLLHPKDHAANDGDLCGMKPRFVLH